MNNAKKILATLLLIIILALTVRSLIVFGMRGYSYWFDEIVSLEIAKKGIQESWQYLRNENNPPMHYWFLHFWIRVFGENEKLVRLSSILLGTLNVAAIYLLAKAMTGKKAVGLAAAFIVAFSSFQIYLSIDARMYSMLFFFSIMSCYFFWLLAQGSEEKYHKIMYCIISAAALYTHLTALFILAGQALFCFYYHKEINWKKMFIGQIVALLLFIPWLYFFVSGSLARLSGDAWYFNTNISGNGFYLLEMPKIFLILIQKMVMAELVMVFIFIILIIANFVKSSHLFTKEKKLEIYWDGSKQTTLALILFVCPLICGFVLQLWVAKYFLASALGFYLLLAMGVDKLFVKDRHKIIFGVIMLIFFLPFMINIGFSQGGHPWDKVAIYLKNNEKPHDKIFLPAFVYELLLRYYYKGESEIISLAPDSIEKDILLRAVKYNWAPLSEASDKPGMEDLLNGVNRVLIVYPVVPAPVHRAEKTLDWFIFNGWCLYERKQFGGFEQPAVFIFVNPNSSEIGECRSKKTITDN